MGCDIHAHVEVEIDGRWEHYSALDIPRNYRLFTKLAGVRSRGDDGDPTPISKPRGLPDDLTTVTRFSVDSWEGDMHSASWITGKEADEVERWFNETKQHERVYPAEPFGYLFGNGFAKPYSRDPNCTKRLGKIRVVFWFDN